MRAILAACLLAVLPLPAVAQQTKGEWFNSLRQPVTGISCCSAADCAVTPAKVVDGQWFVTEPARIDAGHWIPLQPVRWVAVPEWVIIKDKGPWDGVSAYVCWVQGKVFCFVQGEAGG